jgi:heme/copper-type cytochrome/quinol oxidase subunit 1
MSQSGQQSPAATRLLRVWALMGAGAMAAAGLLALLLALSRTPHIGELLPWGPGFFRKALITHVDFSFVVWFLALLGASFTLALARLGQSMRAADRWAAGLFLCGFAAMALPALLERGQPYLNNYVPMLDDPLFVAGLGLIFAGAGLAALRLLAALPRRCEGMDPFAHGVALAALALLASFVTLLIAYAALPAGLDPATFYERLFWGAGHVQQFAFTILMLAIWQELSSLAFGRPSLGPKAWRAALLTLLPFILAAPFFHLLHPILGLANKQAFTSLFLFGLALAPAVLGLGVLAQAWKASGWRKDPGALALVFSVLLFGAGGIMGYGLGTNDTRIPAHYHAVIGGVNLALMGLFYAVLLPYLGRPLKPGRAANLSIWLYGLGQFLWTAGMYLAGAMGVARKTSGQAQGLDSLAKNVSMGVMGLGGAIAVAGGIVFIWLALRYLLGKEGRA